MKNALLFALSVGGLSVAQPALAATLYESAPSSGSDIGLSYLADSEEYNFLAQFTVTTSVNVTGFEILTSTANSAVGGNVAIKLLDNVSLFSAAGQIESLTTFAANPAYSWASSSIAPLTLTAGTYWIGMSGIGYSLQWATTFANGPSNAALVMFGDNFVDQDQDGFIDVLDENFAFRVIGTPIEDAIPEPSTWLMMIAGFGLAGATLRRRRVHFQTV